MTVKFLAGKLTKETVVIIKDQDTGKTLFTGKAEKAIYDDTVKDWDFSKDHVIFV